ncbi:MAG: hypothetical protein E7L17_13195 [Clostridium sp.]|uniref:hypothetical protein n=1 Tax=Clostridium sp. TaxID=1506 RepID=UPI0029084BE6|nr:hypothetical protein [Clostridium sp.]MDU7339058.1 hypothetical protein [Clostridium sp.]
MLIPIAEYAKMHDKAITSVRQKAARKGFETAKKMGRDWFIDSDEPYPDNRVKTGKCIGWRKSSDK